MTGGPLPHCTRAGLYGQQKWQTVCHSEDQVMGDAVAPTWSFLFLLDHSLWGKPAAMSSGHHGEAHTARSLGIFEPQMTAAQAISSTLDSKLMNDPEPEPPS